MTNCLSDAAAVIVIASLCFYVTGCGYASPRALVIESATPCPPSERGAYDAGADLAGPAFDRGEALQVMSDVDVNACAEPGETGSLWVQVRFENDGHVSSATACEHTLRASLQRCIEGKFRELKVSPFGGQGVSAKKRVKLGS
jgi:hypothetical protein